MNRRTKILRSFFFPILLAPAMVMGADVASSPWGPDDEIGRLNMITPESRKAALENLNPATTYDLSVEYYIGMPSWQEAGDPRFQMWMTHTPKGTQVDDPMSVGDKMNAQPGCPSGYGSSTSGNVDDPYPEGHPGGRSHVGRRQDERACQLHRLSVLDVCAYRYPYRRT